MVSCAFLHAVPCGSLRALQPSCIQPLLGSARHLRSSGPDTISYGSICLSESPNARLFLAAFAFQQPSCTGPPPSDYRSFADFSPRASTTAFAFLQPFRTRPGCSPFAAFSRPHTVIPSSTRSYGLLAQGRLWAAPASAVSLHLIAFGSSGLIAACLHTPTHFA